MVQTCSNWLLAYMLLESIRNFLPMHQPDLSTSLRADMHVLTVPSGLWDAHHATICEVSSIRDYPFPTESWMLIKSSFTWDHWLETTKTMFANREKLPMVNWGPVDRSCPDSSYPATCLLVFKGCFPWLQAIRVNISTDQPPVFCSVGNEGMNPGPLNKRKTSWMGYRCKTPFLIPYLSQQGQLAMGQNPNRTPREHPNPH